jgi:hypothetical protein
MDGMDQTGATGEFTENIRPRRRREAVSEKVTSRQRHSERAARLPLRRRQQVVRFADFFARLYHDTGLTHDQVRARIVLRYAAMYREEGLGESEANAAAERLAPGRGTISRLSSPALMLAQGGVDFWRVSDVIEVCGSALDMLAAEVALEGTTRERSLSHRRRLEAFTRRFNLLSPQAQEWVLQDMTRYAEREQQEARLRSQGQADLDRAMGLPSLPLPPRPHNEEEE